MCKCLCLCIYIFLLKEYLILCRDFALEPAALCSESLQRSYGISAANKSGYVKQGRNTT